MEEATFDDNELFQLISCYSPVSSGRVPCEMEEIEMNPTDVNGNPTQPESELQDNMITLSTSNNSPATMDSEKETTALNAKTSPARERKTPTSGLAPAAEPAPLNASSQNKITRTSTKSIKSPIRKTHNSKKGIQMLIVPPIVHNDNKGERRRRALRYNGTPGTLLGKTVKVLYPSPSNDSTQEREGTVEGFNIETNNYIVRWSYTEEVCLEKDMLDRRDPYGWRVVPTNVGPGVFAGWSF